MVTDLHPVEAAIQRAALVPVYASDDLQAAKDVLAACYQGGMRVFEFTNRTPNALKVFGALREHAAGALPDLLLGAGTITTAAAAADYIAAGASFLVSPVAAEEAAIASRNAGVPFAPGATTPTEIHRAISLGAGIVKLFPAGSFGPAYLRQVLGPMPGARLMVTGGVAAEPDTVASWLNAGAVAVGLGSDLLPKGRPDSAALARLAETCRALVQAAARARQGAA